MFVCFCLACLFVLFCFVSYTRLCDDFGFGFFFLGLVGLVGLVGWVGWVGRLVGWWIGWWRVGWLVGLLVGWLVDCLLLLLAAGRFCFLLLATAAAAAGSNFHKSLNNLCLAPLNCQLGQRWLLGDCSMYLNWLVIPCLRLIV